MVSGSNDTVFRKRTLITRIAGVFFLCAGVALILLGLLETRCFSLFSEGGRFHYEGFGFGSSGGVSKTLGDRRGTNSAASHGRGCGQNVRLAAEYFFAEMAITTTSERSYFGEIQMLEENRV